MTPLSSVDGGASGSALDRSLAPSAARWPGVYPAVVADNQDPDGQGRVKVRLPWSPDADGDRYEAWARLATLMAGHGRGTWFVPEEEDEVLVAFEGGDPRRPYVLGSLWNGADAPPETMNATDDLRTILSREGIRVTFDDTQGDLKLRLETPGGQKVVLRDSPSSVVVEDASGNSVKLEAQGITVTAAAKVTVNAATVEVSAGMVTVSSALSKFSGVIQCDTLISNLVVSASYTPGAGNVW